MDEQHDKSLSRAEPTALLIAGQSSVRDIVSDFLATQGCACTCVASPDECAGLHMLAFDAVLVDAAGLGKPVSWIMQIVEACPEVSDRIFEINSAVAHPQTPERSTDDLLQQVRASLWESFMTPRSAGTASQRVEVARLVFDSFHSSRSKDVRGARTSTRQLAYRHKGVTIDVFIEPKEDSGLVRLAGQILGPYISPGENNGVTVLLLDGMKIQSQTSTNQFGEFRLEFPFLNHADVQLRLRGSWTSIPLGKMEWVKKLLSQDGSKP
jgi:hypothetical protein